MTTAPGELTAATVIGLIESGAYGREIVSTIARGFLPLPQQDLIGVLVYLARHPDPEVAASARTTLDEDVPRRAMFEYASNEELDGAYLQRLLELSNDNLVLEALIRNRAVTDAAIADLARHADPRVQEVIVINQARIIRAPQILDALLENPGLSPDARRRALETKEEFFEKKARLLQLEEEAAAEAAADAAAEAAAAAVSEEAIADLLEKAKEFGDAPAESTVPTLTESERQDEKKASIWAQATLMSVSEKVQMAFKGNRTWRMILVRERNKLICSAVMRNPRMTDQEAESIAGMRNVEDEVLRLISMRRDWMSKYNIMITLCRNPKTPAGVVLPLINRLTLRDLKGLKDDKGVQQVVREIARKLYQQRSTKN
jgi:hypothetical protein